MVEIFLLWTFLNGNVHDVDAFHAQAKCDEALATISKMVEMAQNQRPELLGYAVIGCQPVKVEPPVAPPRKTI